MAKEKTEEKKVEEAKVEAKPEAKPEARPEEVKAEAKPESKSPPSEETAETEPPPPVSTPAEPTPSPEPTEAWTQPVPDAPAETPPSPATTVNGVNGAAAHADSNGAAKGHLLGHRVCVLSLPQGREPVNEEVARCIGPFAPTVAKAVAHALRSTGTKVSYPVTVVALDTSKSGEAAIVHNERV